MPPSPTGLIFDLKKFSLHDGPGIRTTVFLKGCPLHCSWCHNPEGISPSVEIHFWEKRCIACHDCIDTCENQALTLVDGKRSHNQKLCQGCGSCAEACPAEAIEMVGTKTTVSDLMDEIEKDTLYYDQSDGGVTFSGGEPLLQLDFIEALLNCCVDKGIHTAIDTSGYVPKDSLSRVLPLADLFLYDVKMMDSNRHLQYTGVSNQRILANLKYLADAGANIIPRIPIIPGINDQNENVYQTGKFLQSLGTIKEINILPYHRTAESKYSRMEKTYPLENLLPTPEENSAEIAWILENFGFKVKIGG